MHQMSDCWSCSYPYDMIFIDLTFLSVFCLTYLVQCLAFFDDRGRKDLQTLALTVVRSIQQKGNDSVPRASRGSHVIRLRPYQKPFPRQPHVSVPSRFAQMGDSSPHRSSEEAVARQRPCEFATDSQSSKLRVFVDLKITLCLEREEGRKN